MREFKKYFINLGMLIAVAAALALPVISNIKLIRSERFWENLQIGNRINFFTLTFFQSGLFIPLLTGMSAATVLCAELNSGYYKNILLRESQTKYALTTLFWTMLSGGISTALPGITTGIIALFGKPYTGQETYGSGLEFGWMGKYCTLFGGNISILIYIFTLFVFGCVWSTYSLIFAALFKNIYITLAAPFLTTFLFQILLDQMNLSKYAPMNMFGGECTAIPSMSFVMIYEGILFLIFAALFMFVIKRRFRDG